MFDDEDSIFNFSDISANIDLEEEIDGFDIIVKHQKYAFDVNLRDKW